ncbi:acetate--CoA ligase family protein [Salinisphaera sp. T31B1]|uniref:acetate--CoA ligase family protein n=1 Tax=Salinisphaera sp. T31B1 TaxID=727963 RepID=UPI003342447C
MSQALAIGQESSAVHAAFEPRSIAVVGASEDMGKFGGRILHYLLHHRFAGQIFPVNATRDQVCGLDAYASLDDLPSTPDLVVICVPQRHVHGVVESAGRLGVGVAVVVSNGFADAGDEGRQQEQVLVALAQRHGLRLVGPNCMGFVSAATGVIVCSSNILAIDSVPTGGVGFISQSGAVLMALMDCGFRQGIGFSHCVTLGNQADLELCDFVEYLLEDDATQVICTYVEGLKDAERFQRLARRAAAQNKPWIMLKSGRTAAGAEAAYSHTASLAGSYQAFETVCRENGIILVEDVESLLCLAAILEKFPGQRLDRVALSSTSGGSLALCADRLSDEGIKLAELSSETLDKLHEHYPASVSNPVDIGVATQGALGRVARPTAEILLSDPGVDIFLPVLSTAPDVHALTQWYIEGAEAAGDKPYLVVLQPAALADSTRLELRRRGIAFVDSFDALARALRAWKQTMAAPRKPADCERPAGLPAPGTIAAPSGAMDETQAKTLLDRYGIRTNLGVTCTTPEQAGEAAANMQFPVVVKIVSPDIVHKSDMGGVALNLDSVEAVEQAARDMAARITAADSSLRLEGFSVQEQATGKMELVLGVNTDEQFGPMIVFGAGGTLVEILSDVAVASAPVARATARALLERLRIYKVLAGARGNAPLDIDAVAEQIERLSWLAEDFKDSLQELDINPLLVDDEGRGAVAVDARALFKK